MRVLSPFEPVPAGVLCKVPGELDELELVFAMLDVPAKKDVPLRPAAPGVPRAPRGPRLEEPPPVLSVWLLSTTDENGALVTRRSDRPVVVPRTTSAPAAKETPSANSMSVRPLNALPAPRFATTFRSRFQLATITVSAWRDGIREASGMKNV